MKEKYFDTIKKVGILLNILVCVVCMLPWIGYFLNRPYIGLTHTTVTYYRFKNVDEMSSLPEWLQTIKDMMGESKFEEFTNAVSESFYNRIYEWKDESKQDGIIADLVEDAVIKEVEEEIGLDKLKAGLSIFVKKEKVKINRGGIYYTKNGADASELSVDHDCYTSLVMMSIGFFVSFVCVFKYQKESQLRLSLMGLLFTCVGAAANIYNDVFLVRAIEAKEWAIGSKISPIGQVVGYGVYSLAFLYAVLIVLMEIQTFRKKKSSSVNL